MLQVTIERVKCEAELEGMDDDDFQILHVTHQSGDEQERRSCRLVGMSFSLLRFSPEHFSVHSFCLIAFRFDAIAFVLRCHVLPPLRLQCTTNRREFRLALFRLLSLSIVWLAPVRHVLIERALHAPATCDLRAQNVEIFRCS